MNRMLSSEDYNDLTSICDNNSISFNQVDRVVLILVTLLNEGYFIGTAFFFPHFFSTLSLLFLVLCF
jgi:hypothetical protein